MERTGNGGQRPCPPPVRPDGSDRGKRLVEKRTGPVETTCESMVGTAFGEDKNPFEGIRKLRRFLGGARGRLVRPRFVPGLALHGRYAPQAARTHRRTSEAQRRSPPLSASSCMR